MKHKITHFEQVFLSIQIKKSMGPKLTQLDSITFHCMAKKQNKQKNIFAPQTKASHTGWEQHEGFHFLNCLPTMPTFPQAVFRYQLQ